MNEKLSLCVIIPVHKPKPTVDEVVSLRACKKQLAQYDCFLVYPEGMDTAAYTAVHNGLQLKPVDPAWLSSVERRTVPSCHQRPRKLSLDWEALPIGPQR